MLRFLTGIAFAIICSGLAPEAVAQAGATLTSQGISADAPRRAVTQHQIRINGAGIPYSAIAADDIISGAFELAEQVSIDSLSMPLLGKHLGVGVTSIYWYFRKKDDLLNAMTDRALSRYVFATPYVEASDWRETLDEVDAYAAAGILRPERTLIS